MLRLDDVIWERESDIANAPKIKHSGKKKATKKKTAEISNLQNGNSKRNAHARQPGLSSESDDIATKDKGVTLKDLNPEDKQRIARLIKELAKADEEKEDMAHMLNEERERFLSHMKELENEKYALLNRQEFLTEEVKQCQSLLQYYQDLIAMQQATVMEREDGKSQDTVAPGESGHRPSLRKSKSPAPSKNVSFRNVDTADNTADELSSQVDAIRIRDFSDACDTDSTFTEDQILRMNNDEYKRYLSDKKTRLKEEQKRLRRLLEMKVKKSESSQIIVSPARDVPADSFLASEDCDNATQTSTEPNYASPTLLHSIQHSPLRATSLQSPLTTHCASRANDSGRYASPPRLTSTLKQSASPSRFLDAQVDIGSYTRDSLLASVHDSEYVIPPLNGVGARAVASDVSAATELLTCDDSQILQEIFFV